MRAWRVRAPLAAIAAGALVAAAFSFVPGRHEVAKASPDVPPGRQRMTVHEWGTFTALQAEDGKAIPGINTDDEPLPSFVHDLQGMVVGPSDVPSVYFKGAPRVHPDVIVRLETPVIYFYPPIGAAGPTKVDVDVAFRGGWLTQFYPDAKAGAPGLDGGRFDFGALGNETVGTLAWHDLKVGGDAPGPETTSPVWLAPRQVKSAASVTTPKGEAERYLFYRGVGHINAPLRVTRQPGGSELEVRGQFGDAPVRPEFSDGPLWLVDVRDDGAIAYTAVDHANLTRADGPAAVLPGGFSEKEYAKENFAKVRSSLHHALVSDGLYADEADGLLNTWEVSYFRRPGLRLFFLCPRQWTDHVLPLHVSGSADLTRAMVGRIEIVTPRQRDLLRQVSAGPISQSTWVFDALKKAGGGREDYYREDWYKQLMAGTRSVASLNVEIPADYRAYLNLGRFRNALILDEQSRRPSDNLAKFIRSYDLEAAQTKANRP